MERLPQRASQHNWSLSSALSLICLNTTSPDFLFFCFFSLFVHFIFFLLDQQPALQRPTMRA